MNDVLKIEETPPPALLAPASASRSPTDPSRPHGDASSVESTEPSSAGSSWATFWLTDRDIAVFTFLAVVVLTLLGVRWVQLSGWGRHEIELERLTPIEYSYRLDLNTATWVEFAQLEGIGETLAMRIVEDRETNGDFQTIDDLDRVKGIGPKTLERLRPHLTATPGSTATPQSTQME